MFSVTTFDRTPACADRLDLVDLAYTSPGKAEELRALCVHCPIAAQCLDLAMHRRETGVWGGTSPNLRVRHGGPTRPGSNRSIRVVEPKTA